MSANGKAAPPRRSRPLYTCAEDLCDAREEESYTPPKPARRRAVRLMDEIEPEKTDRPIRKPVLPSPERSGETEPFSARPSSERAPRINAPRINAPRINALHTRPEQEDLGELAWEADAYGIESVTPEGAGETVALILTLPAVDGGKPEQLKLHLLTEQYAELSPRVGEITAEAAEALLHAGRLCAAVKRGMNLLAYGDQSARRLAFKLTSKGIDRAIAEEAAAYLSEKGYIHEDDTARLRAAADVRKLWGPRRIREDLRANGFASDAIEEALESLADVDFEANCVALIRRKHRSLPADRAERQKMIAALLRQGYDMDIIRAAMQAVEEDA